MKKSFLVLSVMASAFAFYACSKDSGTPTTPPPPPPPSGATASFATDINPVVSTKCTGCHSGNFPSAGLSLTSHAVISANIGKIVNRIQGVGSLMPQGGPALDAATINKFKAWQTAGVPNN